MFSQTFEVCRLIAAGEVGNDTGLKGEFAICLNLKCVLQRRLCGRIVYNPLLSVEWIESPAKSSRNNSLIQFSGTYVYVALIAPDVIFLLRRSAKCRFRARSDFPLQSAVVTGSHGVDVSLHLWLFRLIGLKRNKTTGVQQMIVRKREKFNQPTPKTKHENNSVSRTKPVGVRTSSAKSGQLLLLLFLLL